MMSLCVTRSLEGGEPVSASVPDLHAKSLPTRPSPAPCSCCMEKTSPSGARPTPEEPQPDGQCQILPDALPAEQAQRRAGH